MNLAEQLRKILDGIDCTETEYEHGWWETSTGANFGKCKLNEVETLFQTGANALEQIEHFKAELEKIHKISTDLKTSLIARNVLHKS